MSKVLVNILDDFLTEIDEIANSQQRTRSELIREALRFYIRRVQKTQKALDNADTLKGML
ncbi:MAG: ribbon-helix-helix protein, CopG family [Heliobacteriaceae bacterium]|jgi:metal-responsive CopG/Arc/MetJ family transcriptional regulator|nr:ribbon-helix-helix protein, CopG family [Heliobacteriaceae bacterium]